MEEDLPSVPVCGYGELDLVGPDRVIVLGYARGIWWERVDDIRIDWHIVSQYFPVARYSDVFPLADIERLLVELDGAFRRHPGEVELPLPVQRPDEGRLAGIQCQGRLGVFEREEERAGRLLVTTEHCGVLEIRVEIASCARQDTTGQYRAQGDARQGSNSLIHSPVVRTHVGLRCRSRSGEVGCA